MVIREGGGKKTSTEQRLTFGFVVVGDLANLHGSLGFGFPLAFPIAPGRLLLHLSWPSLALDSGRAGPFLLIALSGRRHIF